VLVIDEFGLMKLSDGERTELLEILEDRYERRYTNITSQLPVEKLFDAIGNPTLADAIMDRLVHNAHKIELNGPTMRKLARIDTEETSKGIEKKK
jgi:DNA replication protein DnaC